MAKAEDPQAGGAAAKSEHQQAGGAAAKRVLAWHSARAWSLGLSRAVLSVSETGMRHRHRWYDGYISSTKAPFRAVCTCIPHQQYNATLTPTTPHAHTGRLVARQGVCVLHQGLRDRCSRKLLRLATRKVALSRVACVHAILGAARGRPKVMDLVERQRLLERVALARLGHQHVQGPPACQTSVSHHAGRIAVHTFARAIMPVFNQTRFGTNLRRGECGHDAVGRGGSPACGPHTRALSLHRAPQEGLRPRAVLQCRP